MMSPANISRGMAAVLISAALAGGHVARAAAQNVAPLDPSQCSAMAQTISKAVDIALQTTVGKPDLSDIRGTACVMSGRATGLTLHFDDVRQKLEASLARAGWTAVSDFDADGPAPTQKGFAKGSQRVVYELSTEPPCEDVPIVDCKVPLRRGTWSLTLRAFIQ